jgi:predicted RNase H-like HicB family nuclease
MKDAYAILIYWSDDDEAFITTVPELPGCMAHGETRALAIEQIVSMVYTSLKVCT